jgi:transporter family protein
MNTSSLSGQSWLFYAVLAAVAAAAANLFARVGVSEIDSTFATTIRSVVMVSFMLIVCTWVGRWHHWEKLNGVAMTMIVLSGLAGATSWLFGFKALSLAEGMVYRVSAIDKLSVPIAVVLAVIFLRERPLAVNWMGIGLIAVGAYLVTIKA